MTGPNTCTALLLLQCYTWAPPPILISFLFGHRVAGCLAAIPVPPPTSGQQAIAGDSSLAPSVGRRQAAVRPCSPFELDGGSTGINPSIVMALHCCSLRKQHLFSPPQALHGTPLKARHAPAAKEPARARRSSPEARSRRIELARPPSSAAPTPTIVGDPTGLSLIGSACACYSAALWWARASSSSSCSGSLVPDGRRASSGAALQRGHAWPGPPLSNPAGPVLFLVQQRVRGGGQCQSPHRPLLPRAIRPPPPKATDGARAPASICASRRRIDGERPRPPSLSGAPAAASSSLSLRPASSSSLSGWLGLGGEERERRHRWARISTGHRRRGRGEG
ncbi:unnamed protein product [Urochloa humidicola]